MLPVRIAYLCSATLSRNLLLSHIKTIARTFQPIDDMCGVTVNKICDLKFIPFSFVLKSISPDHI